MDLVRRHTGGGPAVDVVCVALLAVRQGSDGERSSPGGSVFRAHVVREGPVCRDDVVVDGVSDLLGQAHLVFAGDARREFSYGDEKRVGLDDPPNLYGDFLEEESNGHELVGHAGVKNVRGLGENARDLVKTGDVVFVLLDRAERSGQRQIREAQVDAIELVDRHLILFEVEVGDTLPQHTNQKVVGELVLLGEARSRYGFKSGKEVLVGLVALNDGFG